MTWLLLTASWVAPIFEDIQAYFAGSITPVPRRPGISQFRSIQKKNASASRKNTSDGRCVMSISLSVMPAVSAAISCRIDRDDRETTKVDQLPTHPAVGDKNEYARAVELLWRIPRAIRAIEAHWGVAVRRALGVPWISPGRTRRSVRGTSCAAVAVLACRPRRCCGRGFAGLCWPGARRREQPRAERIRVLHCRRQQRRRWSGLNRRWTARRCGLTSGQRVMQGSIDTGTRLVYGRYRFPQIFLCSSEDDTYLEGPCTLVLSEKASCLCICSSR